MSEVQHVSLGQLLKEKIMSAESKVDPSSTIRVGYPDRYPKPLANFTEIVEEEPCKDNVFDPVHNPKHYQILPGVEVIDIRKALLDKIQENQSLTYYQADLWSRAFEYILRGPEKNGIEDFKKAQVYLGWLINSMSS